MHGRISVKEMLVDVLENTEKYLNKMIEINRNVDTK